MTLPPPPGAGREAAVEGIDQATLKEIDEALREWDNPDSEGRRLYEATRSEWEETLDPLVEAVKASERLTEADFAIRINTRD